MLLWQGKNKPDNSSKLKYFDNITTENLERIEDNKIYLPPDELVCTCLLRMFTGFISRQCLIHNKSGDDLVIKECECLKKGACFKIFKTICEQIEEMKIKLWVKKAQSEFIVYWKRRTWTK